MNYVFYEMWWRTLVSTSVLRMAIGTFMSAYPDSPGFILLTSAVFPTFFVLSVLFSRMLRRRGQAARAAGAIATSTIEEGMDNVLAVQSLGGNRTLTEAARDRLVLVIAHRLSTIAGADKIVFLEEGQVRESGSHEELMDDPRWPLSAVRRTANTRRPRSLTVGVVAAAPDQLPASSARFTVTSGTRHL